MVSLNNSISVKLWDEQRVKLNWLAAKNHKVKPVHIIRASIDLAAAIADMNQGLLPSAEQVCLQLMKHAGPSIRRQRA